MFAMLRVDLFENNTRNSEKELRVMFGVDGGIWLINVSPGTYPACCI
jgi:hypothetical protein